MALREIGSGQAKQSISRKDSDKIGTPMCLITASSGTQKAVQKQGLEIFGELIGIICLKQVQIFILTNAPPEN
jgi:hypothetical protein